MRRQVAVCLHPAAVCLHPAAVCLRQADHPAARRAAARLLRVAGRQTAALAAVAVAAQVMVVRSRLHPVRAVAAVEWKVSLAAVQKVVVTVAAAEQKIPSVMRIAPTASANVATRAPCRVASVAWAAKANV